MPGIKNELPPAFREGASLSFPVDSLVVGHAARAGIGLVVEAVIPYVGRIRLVHWFVSPYANTPLYGIVEDASSMRLGQLHGALCSPSLAVCISACSSAEPLPRERADCRNLLAPAERRLLGLRGWDIPHDRILVSSNLDDCRADITAHDLPRAWAARWTLRFGLGARECSVTASPASLHWSFDDAMPATTSVHS